MTTNLFFYDRYPGNAHFWVGPLGLHLYWPDLWNSRFDWDARWREIPF